MYCDDVEGDYFENEGLDNPSDASMEVVSVHAVLTLLLTLMACRRTAIPTVARNKLWNACEVALPQFHFIRVRDLGPVWVMLLWLDMIFPRLTICRVWTQGLERQCCAEMFIYCADLSASLLLMNSHWLLT